MQTIDMLARAIQAQSKQVKLRQRYFCNRLCDGSGVRALLTPLKLTLFIFCHACKHANTQIKDLQAKVEDLERRQTRDNISSQHEYEFKFCVCVVCVCVCVCVCVQVYVCVCVCSARRIIKCEWVQGVGFRVQALFRQGI